MVRVFVHLNIVYKDTKYYSLVLNNRIEYNAKVSIVQL